MEAVPRHDPTLSPDDLLAAAAVARAALAPALDRDWSVPAGDLEWSCRRTLDHIIDALINYAGNLAIRSTEHRASPDVDTSQRPVAVALTMVEAAAAILAEVVRAAPPGARGFHEAGMADACGFVAMGCEEILVHSNDIAQGLGVTLYPPAGLAARVRSRLFPWAPSDVDPWDALRWAAGRTALPASPRLGPDWGWHCAPLAEWDGTMAKAKWLP
ncbi:MAG: hypothetical protein ACRDJC_09870 [Thermomicrobiales bacterium]